MEVRYLQNLFAGPYMYFYQFSHKFSVILLLASNFQNFVALFVSTMYL